MAPAEEGDKATIPLSLDGYTDLPPGKIANVVTYLEMLDPPVGPRGPTRPDLTVRRVVEPGVAWYRGLFRRVGEDWLWLSRLSLTDTELAVQLADPATEIHVLERDGEPIGIAELDCGKEGEIEVSLFGVVGEAIGTGAARFLMDATLAIAFREGVRRVWLHTCTFDHPGAVAFYKRSGFAPYKFAIEVSDDPRLTGQMPESAAPHVALIRAERNDGSGPGR